jgi:tRNA(Ile)-lysidine synthase
VGPHPAVAAVRHAVRATLAGLMPGDQVLVACSGGADSLALAAAVAFEAPKAGILAGGITVDHGLQPGSADQAARVVSAMTGLGLSPALSVRVAVPGPGETDGYQGPEGAARSARYAALAAAAQSGETASAVWIMLGHTLEDQAETVLLGLARGSGARSLSGMSPQAGPYLRPLLQIRRAQTTAACTALGLQAWDDPHNCDPAFARVRVRRELMPALASALGPGVTESLARTADLLRADADALDVISDAEVAKLGGTAAALGDSALGGTALGGTALGDAALAEGWPADALAALPEAIRHRVLRSAALAAGCPAGALSQRHIASLDELVTGWHGQRWTDLPGGIRCQRRYGRLLLFAAARSEDPGGRE